MIPVCYIWGYGFIKAFCKKAEFPVYHQESYLLAGFGILTVYSQVFSLIYKVSLAANIIMLIITAVVAIIYRAKLIKELKEIFRKKNMAALVVIFLLFIVFAYGTSGGYIHYDTDLYHAQSIRWIENYGVVRGLGNLHNRLAYNSAAFCLSALFSMSFLGGQSFHVCAGFLAFIIALLCGEIFKRGKLFTPSMSNMARIVAIYYLVNIYDEMVSPASDYFVVLLVIGIVILFLEHAENSDESPYAYGLLSLLALIAMSVKISAALIVLIAIYPGFLLIRNKDIKGIIKFLVAGIFSVIPFFVRNIILSGYLIYPVSGLDLFNPIYKIPLEVASYDAKEVQVYGRGHIDVSRFDESLLVWLPEWFSHLDAINKISFIMAVLGLVALATCLIFCLINLKKKNEVANYPVLWIVIVNAVCFVTMIVTSPNIRFGCVFLWMFPVLIWGYIYRNIVSKLDKQILFKTFLCLFLAYKIVALGMDTIPRMNSEYLLYQKDYGTYEVIAHDIGGMIIYYPREGDQTGYSYFPSVPGIPEAQMIGNDIKDGFRSTLNAGK